jgi:hypothetical protein
MGLLDKFKRLFKRDKQDLKRIPITRGIKKKLKKPKRRGYINFKAGLKKQRINKRRKKNKFAEKSKRKNR